MQVNLEDSPPRYLCHMIKSPDDLLREFSIKSFKIQRCNFFSYKTLVLKCALTTQKCARTHHYEAMFQKFPGGDPRTPTCGRGWPPPPPSPFRRFAPQWSLRLQTLVLQQFQIVLQRENSWTPLICHDMIQIKFEFCNPWPSFTGVIALC